MTFALEGRLGLDARSFVKGGKQAENAVEEIGDAFGKLPKEARTGTDGAAKELGKLEGKAGETGGKAGGQFGSMFTKAFAAAGVGALLAKGISDSMDASKGVKRLQGQFNLTVADAKRYGDLAGQVYADGWGEGLEQVQQAAALTSRRLDLEIGDGLEEITTQVLATSQTWGLEFDAVIRSTSQLMENGLAPNAQAALDLIVGGLQEGGNEAGDMLETIDEYAQHWSAVGLSGEDALNQIVFGLQNGQRDADKLADAVKEMRLRIVENAAPMREALGNIGLNADDTVDAFIEGGPAARTAFLEVIAALEEGQLQGDSTADAVAIIGTQFEDLGPKALAALSQVDGALQDTEGRAAALADTVEATDWDKFQRRAEGALRVVGAGAADALEGLTRNPFGDSGLTESYEAVFAAMEDARLEAEAYGGANAASKVEAMEAAAANADLGDAIDDVGDAQADATAEADKARAALAKQRAEMEKLTAAANKLVGGALGVEQAQIDARDAAAEFDDKTKELTEGTDDYRSVVIDTAEAQLSAAQATVDHRVAMAEAAGTTVDAAGQQGMLRSELGLLASQLDGPVRSALLAEIELLDILMRDRSVSLAFNLSTSGSVATAAGDAIGVRALPTTAIARASGGPTTRGGFYEVTEQGSEMLVEGGRTYLMPGASGQVVPLSPTTAGGAGNGNQYVVNVSAGLGADGDTIGSVVVEALTDWERSNGNGWRS